MSEKLPIHSGRQPAVNPAKQKAAIFYAAFFLNTLVNPDAA
jgi:hypothetical protein